MTNIEEGNFDKEEQDTEILNVRVLASPFVGSRDKIGYGKRKLAEICDAAKGENWKSIECRQWQNFWNCHTYVCIFFKWQSFSQTSGISLVSYLPECT